MTTRFTGSFTQQEPIPDEAIEAAVRVMRTGRLHRYNTVAGEVAGGSSFWEAGTAVVVVVASSSDRTSPGPSVVAGPVVVTTTGSDVDVVVDASSILAKYLGKAADKLIAVFVDAVRHGLGSGAETSVMVDALRSSAGEAARIMAIAMPIHRPSRRNSAGSSACSEPMAMA